MPLNAVGWSTQEDEKLVDLVRQNITYCDGTTGKDLFVQESAWKDIGQALSKTEEECKKRWRGLRSGYVRSRKTGAMHKSKAGVFEKLKFLDNQVDGTEEVLDETMLEVADEQLVQEDALMTEQQVITDNQEYYEITMVEQKEQQVKPMIRILPNVDIVKTEEPPKKIVKKVGRKKSTPMPRNIAPIKILPKPILMNGPKIVQYIEDEKKPLEHRPAIDKLIEKVLKENTNEIDVFFRSMAASVKKLQPNLIPKVKMEVCNVIAKYEMQSFDKNIQKFN